MTDTWAGDMVQLRALVDAKLSAREIGDILGRSRSAVIGKISRSGWKLHNRSGWQRAKSAAPPVPRPRKVRSVIRIIGFRPEIVAEYKEEVRIADAAPLHLSHDQLEFGQCRYPYGDGPFTFCCQPVEPASSYCPAHDALCNVAPAKGSDRAAIELRKRAYARKARAA